MKEETLFCMKKILNLPELILLIIFIYFVILAYGQTLFIVTLMIVINGR